VPPFISHYRIGTNEPEDEVTAPCIFLAEDNPADVGLLQVALEEHNVNCDLFVAADGERAVAFIDELDFGSAGCPALAILDLNLPKRTGREVLLRMRESPVWDSIPVVILTSSDSERDRAETAKLGASKYIKKPSNLEAFLRIGDEVKQLLAVGE
jgi:chemotaxis family two-component system response regulator Rcp1